MIITDEERVPNYGVMLVVGNGEPFGFMHLHRVTAETAKEHNRCLAESGYMDYPAEIGGVIGYLDLSFNGLIDMGDELDEAFGPGWIIEDDLDAFGMAMVYIWFETPDLAEKELRKYERWGNDE